MKITESSILSLILLRVYVNLFTHGFHQSLLIICIVDCKPVVNIRGRSINLRRIRTHIEWKVLTQMLSEPKPTRSSTLCRISPAAYW